MEKGFRLYVRDFGKLEEADIHVAPMTFLVGDNNSGKSYLMALLYSLLNMRLYHEEFDLCRASEEYQRCQSWLTTVFSFEGKTDTVPLSPQVQEQLEALLNRILMANRKKLVQATFNTQVNLGEIRVKLSRYQDCFLRLSREEADSSGEGDGRVLMTPVLDGRKYTRSWARKMVPDFFLCAILEFLLKADFKNNLVNPACFLPTSRTGFLLTYKSLIQSTISDAFDVGESKPSRTQLTRPCTDFLKNLAAISTEHENGRTKKVVDFIQQSMMDGHISVSHDAPQPVFYYHPAHGQCKLPMQLTSGVVTELTPLLLMLKYHQVNVLFIEEPEMGLHPGLQVEMARVLFQLRAAGIPVFVTTHSDTILQHTNNMLKLYAMEDDRKKEVMDELGYNSDDLTAPDDIEMYQFDADHSSGKTRVTELKKGPYGFIVPSFNDVLARLLEISERMEWDDDV